MLNGIIITSGVFRGQAPLNMTVSLLDLLLTLFEVHASEPVNNFASLCTKLHYALSASTY